MCKTFNLTVSIRVIDTLNTNSGRARLFSAVRLFVRLTQDGTKGQEEMDGRGRCPYDPLHNSTSIYAGEQLYAGTVADFSGSDPLVYKEPMRTERLDFKQLNGNFGPDARLWFFFLGWGVVKLGEIPFRRPYVWLNTTDSFSQTRIS